MDREYFLEEMCNPVSLDKPAYGIAHKSLLASLFDGMVSDNKSLFGWTQLSEVFLETT